MVGADREALIREVNQATKEATHLGEPARKATHGSPDWRRITCPHCGAMVRLIGFPPSNTAGMLYYPIQFCPQCGAEIGRALSIEVTARVPWFMPTVAQIQRAKRFGHTQLGSPGVVEDLLGWSKRNWKWLVGGGSLYVILLVAATRRGK